MKLKLILPLVLTAILGCEQIVEVKVNEQPSYLVVDAWLAHAPGQQVIKLTTTQPYYDNTGAKGETNATVTVKDDKGGVFDFVESGEGKYIWSSADTFGAVGRKYFLEISWNGHLYTAESKLNRGASIDSIRFTYEEASGFFPEYFSAEFFGEDPEGIGDTYWLKAWKNGKYLNQPNEIYFIYDASFSKRNGDGIPFIIPIRTFPNPFDNDINRNFIPPYSAGDTFQIAKDNSINLFGSKVLVGDNVLTVVQERDEPLDGGVTGYPLDGEPFYRTDENTIVKKADSVYLELHAITPEAWFFLSRLQEETNRPSGFGALFATPPSNLPTNIQTDSKDVPVAGFFNIAKVSSMGARLSKQTIRSEE